MKNLDFLEKRLNIVAEELVGYMGLFYFNRLARRGQIDPPLRPRHVKRLLGVPLPQRREVFFILDDWPEEVGDSFRAFCWRQRGTVCCPILGSKPV